MIDKSVIQQILGGLMKHPQYFSEVDKYSLTINDFSNRFERYIFTALLGLYRQGATNISPVDVSNFLEIDEAARHSFESNNGVEYLQDIIDFSNEENFPYYYAKLKKLNLLRDMKKQGFDVSDFYIDDPTDNRSIEVNSQFESLSAKEICDAVKMKLLHLESKYAKTSETEVEDAAFGMREFLMSLNDTIDIGPPLQGHIYNKIFGGAQRQALYIRSGSSGLGKALPNSTVIPTPNGWRTVGEIQPGDYLFDAFGKPTQVLQIFPQGKKDVYRVTFKDGREALCNEEHLWSFCTSSQKPNSKKQRKFYTKTLKEIMDMPLCENGVDSILVPMNYAVEYSEKDFRITPYMTGFRGSVPKNYLLGSIQQRYDLLNGLLDDSGYVEGGRVFYTTINSTLKDRVIELCRSLGFKTDMHHSIEDEYTIEIYGRPEDVIKLFEIPSKREKLEALYDSVKQKETNEFNAITKIENCGYQEEMTCFHVDNDEHLFLMNDFIVTHNTRQSVADACYLAYPVRYNSAKRQWEQQGSSEKVLFIVTEQTFTQVRKMILAYLSDISESRFKFGNFTEEEQKILDTAIGIMEKYSDNMVLVKMPNPTIELVKTVIRENCLTKDIGYVFFDYVFIGPSLLNEFRGFNLRNDEVLLMFATALKDLAVELNVAMFTSTQVNASADDNKNIRNEASLAGGRSTINKADNGAIMARPSPEELETLQPLIERFGNPNCVTDVFKCRSGEWTQVRIWSQVDLGRMRKTDLFVTDARLEAIEGFYDDNEYEVHNWTDEEVSQITRYVHELNEKGN